MSGYIGVEPVPNVNTIITQGSLSADTNTIFVPNGYNVGNIEVYINGFRIKETDFSAGDGNNIVFSNTMPQGTDYLVQDVRNYSESQSNSRLVLLETQSREDTYKLATSGGYNMVSGSFEDGASTTTSKDVVWCKTNGKLYGRTAGDSVIVTAGYYPVGDSAWTERTPTEKATAVSVQNGSSTYVADTGVANAYVAVLSPALGALIDGVKVRVKIANTNTGTSTLNVNGLGVKTIYGGAHVALQGGELVVGGYAEFEYNTTLGGWVLLFCTGAAEQVGTASQTQHAVPQAQVQSMINTRSGSSGAFSFRNKIVDGRFDFWYEGTSATYASAAGYGAETLVWNGTSADTMVVTQQPVALGEIPTAPAIQYWSKNVVTSVVGSTSYATKKFRIEDVRTLAGKTVTFSFYAKADAVRNVAIEFIQSAGTGGSSGVSGLSPTIVTLSTTATRYSVTATLPSINSMTIGTGSAIEVNIWMDAGTNSASRNASLGQQSGTFYFTGIQLEEGSVMTPFEELPIEISQQRVNRYFQHRDGAVGSSRFPVQSFLSSNIYKFQVPLITPMRTVPTVTHNMSDATFSISVTTSNQTWGLLTDAVAWSTKSSGTFVISAAVNDRLVDVLISGGVLGSMTTPIAASIGGLTYFNLDARL